MNALTTADKRRATEVARKLRNAAAHDRCLYTFTCSKQAAEGGKGEVSDNRLRWKGVLSFFDSFVDPSAGTRYMICSGPASEPTSVDYFERVGRHMMVVMHDPGGYLVAGPERGTVKRK